MFCEAGEDVFSVDWPVSSILYIGMIEQILSVCVFYPEGETELSWDGRNHFITLVLLVTSHKKVTQWLKQQRGLADVWNLRISEECGSFRYSLNRARVIFLSFASELPIAHLVTLFALESISFLGRHHPSSAWRGYR